MTGRDIVKQSSGTLMISILPALRKFVVVLAFLLLAAFNASAAAWAPEAVIREYLKSHYPWAAVDVSEIEAAASLPADKPSAIMVEKTPPGRSVFRFGFKDGRSILVSANVKAFDRVFMSRSGFRKGYVLGNDDIYQTLMESGRIPRGAVRTAEQAVGKPLLRSIVPNMTITDAMVSETPLVKRGRTVTLWIDEPGFSVRTLGEMKSDAVVGEYVQAMNLKSRKTVGGVLVDENTVRVEF